VSIPVPPRLRRLLPALAGAALLVAGCYPDSPENAEDLNMVVTAKVPGTDYADLHTFAMEDTVIVLDTGDGSGTPIDPSFNPVILQELRAAMVAAGFTDVTDQAGVEPDVQLVCGAVESEVWYYYYYWDYYGGWWYPGWGYYPPAVGVGSFDVGTLMWQLMDLRGVTPGVPDQDVRAAWIAGINGVLQDADSHTEDAIRTGIRQAFTQSPYIRAAAARQ